MLAKQFVKTDLRRDTRVVIHGSDVNRCAAGQSIDDRHVLGLSRKDAGVERGKSRNTPPELATKSVDGRVCASDAHEASHVHTCKSDVIAKEKHNEFRSGG